MHVRQADAEAVKAAIDQCAEVGFEMVIMTFGSGFDAESADKDYIAGLKELADYAHGKGVELGGYSLLASRHIDAANDALNPDTSEPGGAIFGHSPCLGSAWGEDYFRKVACLYDQAGLDILEHDGSYPGDVCASVAHPGHASLADSQWRQWQRITRFYRWCRERGIYLNVPDWYFLNGSNKNGMGYREVNWSLPRERQLLLARQNVYDGTWEKTPSMGWMFVPLVEYHGGDAGAFGRTPRSLRGAPDAELWQRGAGLLSRSANLRCGCDQGGGEEVGGILQAPQRDSGVGYHPPAAARRTRSGRDNARQRATGNARAGALFQPAGRGGGAGVEAAFVLYGIAGSGVDTGRRWGGAGIWLGSRVRGGVGGERAGARDELVYN